MSRLENKVCIVTGSSSGLGRAIALAYAREGGLLVCADLRAEQRNQGEAEDNTNTDELIRKNGGKAIFVVTDVTKAAEFESLIQRTVEEYGRFDVLVNNAGICYEAGRPRTKIHETSEEAWDTTMAVNLRSIFLGCKYAITQMLKQDLLPSGDRGWIINLSSIYGLVAGRYIPSYSASKGAVAHLTKSTAVDYAADRIHCNAICPGFVYTAMTEEIINSNDRDMLSSLHPLRGIGVPTDITGAAVFLASDDARWVTGICMAVDGGYTAQ